MLMVQQCNTFWQNHMDGMSSEDIAREERGVKTMAPSDVETMCVRRHPPEQDRSAVSSPDGLVSHGLKLQQLRA